MSKQPSFRGPLERQQVKWVETLFSIRIATRLHYLLITVKLIALVKVSFSDTQNPKAVC